MFPIWAMTMGAAAAAPTVSAIVPAVGDTAGGGGLVTITGTNFTGATGVTLGGTAATSVTVVNATTITCVPGGHSAATLQSVVVTTPGGSNGANTLFEYWSPVQTSNVDIYLDSNKGVAISGSNTWTDQSVNAVVFTQSVAGNKPVQTASVFGTMPSIRFASASSQFIKAAAIRTMSTGYSFFAVIKTTTTFSAAGGFGVPGTIVGEVGASCWGGFGLDNTASPNGKTANQWYDNGGIARHATAPSVAETLNDGTARLVGVTSDTTPNVKSYIGATQQGTTNSPGGGYDTTNTTYDTIGAGGPSGPVDCFNGDIGAVIVVKGVISGTDLTKLYAWAQQRFGVA